MTTSHDITGKIERETVELFRRVSQAIESLAIPYVVVGATARDLVLHYVYGAEVERATHDVDFAIELPDWQAFERIKAKLAEAGFELTREQHRLKRQGAVVDIVPFGGVEGETDSIAWPPDGDVVMNVLGFQEACDNADQVRVESEPELLLPVATPAGMALLKLIAWQDRSREKRLKDALDLAYLLESYEEIPAVREALYSQENTLLMEGYGWELTQAAAHLLGQDAASIARQETRSAIRSLLSDEGQREQLISEMCRIHDERSYERNSNLLSAFASGFEVVGKAE